MTHTALSFLTDDELLTLAQCKDNATELEKELANRFTIALDYIEDLEDRVEQDDEEEPEGPRLVA